MENTLFPAWIHGPVLLILAYMLIQLGRGHAVLPPEQQRKILESLPILKSPVACFVGGALFAFLGAAYLASHFGLRW